MRIYFRERVERWNYYSINLEPDEEWVQEILDDPDLDTDDKVSKIREQIYEGGLWNFGYDYEDGDDDEYSLETELDYDGDLYRFVREFESDTDDNKVKSIGSII